MKKKTKLITIPYRPERLEVGMYILDEGKLIQLKDGVSTSMYLNDVDTYTDKSQPVQLCLVSDEEIKKGDLCIVRDNICQYEGEFTSPQERQSHRHSHKFINLYPNKNEDKHQWTNTLSNKLKVIATQDQIGKFHYQDANYILLEGFIDDIHTETLQHILNDNGECYIEMEEMVNVTFVNDEELQKVGDVYYEPKLIDNKVLVSFI
jgi:hypothetical protein